MLQQILQSRFVDPEVLSELSDDEKFVLFCKIRAQQIADWKEREAKLNGQPPPKSPRPKKSNKGNVGFVKDEKGGVWTWVMGEHKDDKSIEQILEEEAIKKADELAEKEAEEQRKREEEEVNRRMKEEEERLALEHKKKEEEWRRQQEEAALYQSLKDAKEAQRKLDEEKKQQMKDEKKKLERIKAETDKQLKEIVRRDTKRKSKIELEARSSQIFTSFQEAREKFRKAAEENSKQIENEWHIQESKSKEAEEQMKRIAQKAREEYKRSLKSRTTVIQALSAFQTPLHQNSNGNTNESVPALPAKQNAKLPPKRKPEGPRPKSRNDVIKWFQSEEKRFGVGLDPQTKGVAKWFHGIISRQEAEDLLQNTPVGSFLIRVSEKVWGYALSYRGKERCKHYLIDATDGNYTFIGPQQITHQSINNLIAFHTTKPISELGQEILLFPVGQSRSVPDYDELFHETENLDTRL